MTRKTVGRLVALMMGMTAMTLTLAAQRSQTAVETDVDTLKHKLDKREKVLVIDVRNADEVKSGSIPGAINIPMSELEARMKDISKDVQIVFACDHGNRSSRAAELFQQNGYKATTFCALEDWKTKGYKTGRTKKSPSGAIKP
ncbi:MAG TPA: rhodanese-like domain-containing protein [Terriglobales bacterium]|nr:rhodanese-like domain-containing protein [Terriglobales bacterium]